MIVVIYFIVEFIFASNIRKKKPYIPRLPTITGPKSKRGNNSFVYFTSDNIVYENLTNTHFNISIRGAILSPHLYECEKSSDYFDAGSIFGVNNLPTREWVFLKKQTIAQTMWREAKADGFVISEDIFRFTGSNEPYTPSGSEIEQIENSGNSEFVYIGDGWFYKSDIDVKESMRNARGNYEYKHSHSQFSFVFVGNPIFSIIIEILSLLWKNFVNQPTTQQYNQKIQYLFNNCKPGDQRLKFWKFDSSNISIVAYRSGNILKTNTYKGNKMGKIVAGKASKREIMRPKDNGNGSLSTFRVITLIIVASLVRKVSENEKENVMNVILVSLIVYSLRSFIWNIGILEPTFATSLLIGYVILYVKA